ncbi:hypothetical protein ACWEP5_36725 [Nocardia niigatensis]
MNVVLWTGFAFWFPGAGVLFASRWFKRWGREDPAAEVGALLSVIGAVLLAIATPAVSEDPVWQRVLYDVMLTGWRRPEQAVAIHRVAMDTVRTDVSHTIAR